METLYSTAKELAEIFEVHQGTIRRWVKKHNIKHVMEGNLMLIDLTAFWKWYYKEIGYEVPE